MLAYAGTVTRRTTRGRAGRRGGALEGSREPQGQIAPPGLGGMTVTQACGAFKVIRRQCQTNIAVSDIHSPGREFQRPSFRRRLWARTRITYCIIKVCANYSDTCFNSQFRRQNFGIGEADVIAPCKTGKLRRPFAEAA